jgi:hypothetical protein
VDPDIIFVNNTSEMKSKHDPAMSHYIKRNDKKIERRKKNEANKAATPWYEPIAPFAD